jgi:Domain of unknown function (DUF4291)
LPDRARCATGRISPIVAVEPRWYWVCMETPERQIRAFYGPETIRVYQAFSDEIADSALKAQTFVSPPFSMSRMTWIKPSFLWMMYRSGWGKKDSGQKRIIAIDITHEGFAWAIEHSCQSHPDLGMSPEDWAAVKERSPVRVQWDPERDLHHNSLPYRAIQVGLGGEAVRRYVTEWIVRISDETLHASMIHDFVLSGQLGQAQAHLPRETPYIVGMNLHKFLAGLHHRLLETNHDEHEDIVQRLQHHAHPESVEYLRSAIELKPSLSHLDWDDNGSFYKKCLWALQDIGTGEALAVIKHCASSQDEALKEQATYRLKRIAEGGRQDAQLPKQV